MYFIGIDLGTSAMKLLLVENDGAIVNSTTKEYPLRFPHPVGRNRIRPNGGARCFRASPS